MAVSSNRGFFKALSGETITINAEDSVIGFSLSVISGVCIVNGTGTFQGQESTPVEIPAGTPYTELASLYCVLDGYTIEATGDAILSIKK